METGLRGKRVLVTGRVGRDRLGLRAGLRRRGRAACLHWHRGEERARAMAEELGGAPVSRPT